MYLLQDQRHYLLRAQRELRMGKAEDWAAAKNAENVRIKDGFHYRTKEVTYPEEDDSPDGTCAFLILSGSGIVTHGFSGYSYTGEIQHVSGKCTAAAGLTVVWIIKE